MAVKKYPKTSQEKLSEHFNVSEFACPCTSCTQILIDTDLIERLEGVRQLLNQPINVNSGFRCARYQDELRLRGYETAIGKSQHTLGKAADIQPEAETPGAEIEKAARQVGFKAVGVGHSWCHVDLRDDKERRWTYEKR